MIQIREMTIEDCPDVANIDQACFTQAWSVAMFRDTLSFPTYHYVVAVWTPDRMAEEHTLSNMSSNELTEDGTAKLIGFAGLSTSIDTADVVNIGVLPEYRRQGIGEQLFQKLEEIAILSKCNTIMLEVRESNTAAIHLYQKFGFQEIAVRKNYYSNPIEHGIVMQKQL